MSNKHIFFIHGVGVQSDEKLQRKIGDLAENFLSKNNGCYVNTKKKTTVQLSGDIYNFHYINWYKMCDYSRKNIKYNFKNILRIFNFLPLLLYVLAKDRGDENEEEPLREKGFIAKLFMSDPVSTISNARSISRIGILFLAIFSVLWIIFNFGILPVVIFLGFIAVCLMVWPKCNWISHIYNILDDIHTREYAIIRNICSNIEENTEDGDEIILVGHSLGGYISHHISLNFNNYIQRRILIRLITVQSGLRPVTILQNIYSAYSRLWKYFFFLIYGLCITFLATYYIKPIYEYLINIFDGLGVSSTISTLLASTFISFPVIIPLVSIYHGLNFRLPRSPFKDGIEGPSFRGLWIDIFSPRDIVSRFVHPDIKHNNPYIEVSLTPEYNILGNHKNYFKKYSESLDIISISITSMNNSICENSIKKVINNWDGNSRPRMFRLSLYYARMMYIYLIIAELFIFLQISKEQKYLVGPIVLIVLSIILVIFLYKTDDVMDLRNQDYSVFYIMTIGGSAIFIAEIASAYMFGSMIFLDGASWIYSTLIFFSSMLTLICILLQNPRYRINISMCSVLISYIAISIENWNGYSANMLPIIIAGLAFVIMILSANQPQLYIIHWNANNVINKLTESGRNVINLDDFINLIVGDNKQFTVRDVRALYINKIDNYDGKKYHVGNINIMVDKKGNKVYLKER